MDRTTYPGCANAQPTLNFSIGDYVFVQGSTGEILIPNWGYAFLVISAFFIKPATYKS